MAVTKIDPSEMPEMRVGRIPDEESLAVAKLEPGEAIKFPCRWKHKIKKSGQPSPNACSGVNVVRATGSRAGFVVASTCRNKVVYVMRTAETS